MGTFSARLPRRMYWANRVTSGLTCPDCGGILTMDNQIYMMAVRKHGGLESFVVGSDAGHFCSGCPVVVIDKERMGELAALAAHSEEGAQFTVLGLVDLEAIPKDKFSSPLDTDDNPIPLVKFTNLGSPEKHDLAGCRPQKSHFLKRRTKRQR